MEVLGHERIPSPAWQSTKWSRISDTAGLHGFERLMPSAPNARLSADTSTAVRSGFRLGGVGRQVLQLELPVPRQPLLDDRLVCSSGRLSKYKMKRVASG